MSTEVTGLHYIFWNVGVSQKDEQVPSNELRPTYDLYWSSKAADLAMKRYKEKRISVHRIDYPWEDLSIDEADGLSIFKALNTRSRNKIAFLFFKNITAERRWRQWLKDGRPELTK